MAEDVFGRCPPLPYSLQRIRLESIGQNVKKKIPKRPSYSRVLNNQKSLDYIAETNLLSSCISKISVAKEIAKDAAKEKREQEQKSREGKKADD